MRISYHGAKDKVRAHGVGGFGHTQIGTIMTMIPMMSERMDGIELT